MGLATGQSVVVQSGTSPSVADVLNTTPVGTEYGLVVRTVGGASGGGGPATIADGADVAEGATSDAAVITDTTGTVSGKLRGLVKWAFERNPASLGAKTSAASFPVVIASDQATFPVTTPTNASVNVAQLAATATSVNSGTKDAGTLRVVLATDQPQLTNKLLVTPDSVALPANQSVNVAQFGANTVATGTGAGGVGIPRVTVSNDSNVIVTPPTLTKGTQGATGFSTQDLKDAGRVRLSFYANNVASGTTGTETLITLSKSSDQAAVTTATSFVVTNAKRFRIASITFGSRGNATAVAQISTFALRINTAGAITTGSLLVLAGATATPATSSAWDRLSLPVPDGFEILGDGTLQFGVSANAVFVTSAPTWFVNIIGYEY